MIQNRFVVVAILWFFLIATADSQVYSFPLWLTRLTVSSEWPIFREDGTNTYYVAPNGDDNNPGTREKPWKTTYKAGQTAVAGDTVIFRSGTYYGQLKPQNSGNHSAGWITFKANPGEKPIIIHDTYWSRAIDINGVNFIEINGLTAVAAGQNGPGISISNAHHVAIRYCTVKESATSGIATTYGVDYILIEGNHIYGNSERGEFKGSGISIWNSGGPIFDNYPGYHIIIRKNKIYDNRNLISNPSDGNGIILDNNDRGGTPDQQNPKTLIANNIIFDNGGRCIHLLNSSNTDIINNTCYHNVETAFISDNCGGEISLQRTYDYSSSINIQIFNNIVYGKGGTCNKKDQTYLFQVWCGQSGCPQYTSDYNLWFNGTVIELGPHDLVDNPEFKNASLNPASANFSLMPESPAIDRGTDQFAEVVPIDYMGVQRPQGNGFDMGAYEYRFLNYFNHIPVTLTLPFLKN